jgi:protein phosphatase 1 regulatory subunit 32
MGRIVADNYHTITERSFRPYTGPTGSEALPNSIYHAGSGFIRTKPIHNPTHNEALSSCIAAKVASAPPVDILPRHKPHLHKIQRKDPVELENGGYGPGCMTTETSERFKGQPADQPDLFHKSIGDKEHSGFTHNQNIEPVTFHPDYAYRGDAPGYLTPRPTGLAVTDTHFRPAAYATGKEPLPNIANRSHHDSGFTVGSKANSDIKPDSRVIGKAYDKASELSPLQVDRTQKQDPMEYLNMMHPNNRTSVTQCTFLGKQQSDPTDADRLGTTSVGWKENTGFTSNNPKHIWAADNPARFVTDYQMRFLDRTPQGNDRQGHVWGGIMIPREDGFTRSTTMHNHGPQINTSETLRRLEPYVARSIKARDTFYDDHLYDTKTHTSAVAV